VTGRAPGEVGPIPGVSPDHANGLDPDGLGPGPQAWKRRWFVVVFGHETRAGKLFDLALIGLILASVLVAVLDTVPALHVHAPRVFLALEWGFTLLFTAEYLLRLWIVDRPARYARSFYGVIDLLAILPTWLSLLFPGSQYLAIVRILRILRVFRILKMARYLGEAGVLAGALRRSARKIVVFVFVMLTIVTVFGGVMYVVEGPEHGFTSIPTAMYWAIVTVATVGYGDIAPGTPLGRFIASCLILVGYGMIAVPTGIYTAEIAQGLRGARRATPCARCALHDHEADALHCRRCGHDLGAPWPPA
jgi:voltage-gated potassium channel